MADQTPKNNRFAQDPTFSSENPFQSSKKPKKPLVNYV